MTEFNMDIITHLSRQTQVHSDLIRAMAQKIGELQMGIGQLYMLLNQKNPDTLDIDGTSKPAEDVSVNGTAGGESGIILGET